jgi:O-antigen ligase
VVDLRASVTLERALQVLIVATIVSAVLAAGSVVALQDEARAARWLFLIALAVLASGAALGRRETLRPGRAHALAAALVALALLSAAWSSEPGLTLARGVSLALLLGASAAVMLTATGSPDTLRRFAHAVVAAAAAVAVGGLLVLALDRDRAIQPASAQEAARYQGLGGGPNTASMLLAVALPLAAYVALEARTPGRRALALALAALLLGSVVASGSRGSLVAAVAGLAAFAALAARTWSTRAAALAVVGALAVASVLALRLPEPDPDVAALPGTALPAPVIKPADGYLDADVVWRLKEDVGRPPWGQTPENTERSLLGGSGRRQAWGGAIGLGADRPALGYAFGLEAHVFVDRYLEHGSDLPENSYVGLFLQLGALGVVLFVALTVALLAAGWRAVRRSGPGLRPLAAAATGVFVAGLALALTQSYIYAAGSNATLAVWLCAFLLPAAARLSDVHAA